MESRNINFQKSWQQRLLNKFYFSRPNWINGTTEFHELIAKFVKPIASILEVGAGPSNETTAFLATLGSVTGLDVDVEIFKNHYCTKTILYDGSTIPCSSCIYDAVVLNYVCEHIEYPLKLTHEIYRVLKPGGMCFFRTPNTWHYVSLVSKLTSHRCHQLIADRLRNLGTDAHEPYRTFYRMNTPKACRKILNKAGFTVLVLKCIEKEPSYGMASPLMFYPLMIWERILNSTEFLEPLRANILCAAKADLLPEE